MVLGGGWDRAAKAIRVPVRTAKAAAHEINTRVAVERAAFDAAIDNLADVLDAAAPALIDYGRRRRALRDWTISPGEWSVLTEDLKAADTHRDNPDRPTDWGDGKRLSASAWVLARVTSSEVRYAPAFNPAPVRSRPTSLVGATASPRYHLARRDYGHYAALRTRLTEYAEALYRVNRRSQGRADPGHRRQQAGHGLNARSRVPRPGTGHTVSGVRGGLEPAEPDVPSSGRST
jgi:hypothetical protein